MAIVKSWKSYGFGGEYLTTKKVLKCIDIMRHTAVQHSLELKPLDGGYVELQSEQYRTAVLRRFASEPF